MSFGSSSLRVLLLMASVAVTLPRPASGQAGRILPVEDPAYLWIGRLQDRGLLVDLAPGALPYTMDEVRAAMESVPALDGDDVASRWMSLLAARIGPVARPPGGGETTGATHASEPVPARSGQTTTGFTIDPGVRASSSRRIDPLRELGSTPNAYPNILFSLWGSSGRFTAEVSARVDAYYDRDPDGLDAALRGFSRSENTYIGYESRGLSVHLGRFSTHWGLPGEPALVLSSNPRTIDALRMTLGGRRLALRSFFGELDSITGDGRYTGAAGDDSVASGSERRWLAAHRLDWRPSERLAITLSEAVLFSGRGSGWSMKYLNPLQPALLETDNLPKNDENNGLVALSIWARTGSTTWSGQVMVDDFDLMNFDERASIAATLRALRSNLRPGMDAGFTSTAVAARTYDTFQPEGRWLHLLRGIATQTSDFVESSVFVRWYADGVRPGLVLEPRLTALWQGERDIRLPYGPEDRFGTLLTGVVERTLRAAVRVSWEPGPSVHLTVDAGVNRVDGLGHVAGASRTRPSVVASVSFRLLDTRTTRQDD